MMWWNKQETQQQHATTAKPNQHPVTGTVISSSDSRSSSSTSTLPQRQQQQQQQQQHHDRSFTSHVRSISYSFCCEIIILLFHCSVNSSSRTLVRIMANKIQSQQKQATTVTAATATAIQSLFHVQQSWPYCIKTLVRYPPHLRLCPQTLHLYHVNQALHQDASSDQIHRYQQSNLSRNNNSVLIKLQQTQYVSSNYIV